MVPNDNSYINSEVFSHEIFDFCMLSINFDEFQRVRLIRIFLYFKIIPPIIILKFQNLITSTFCLSEIWIVQNRVEIIKYGSLGRILYLDLHQRETNEVWCFSWTL